MKPCLGRSGGVQAVRGRVGTTGWRAWCSGVGALLVTFAIMLLLAGGVLAAETRLSGDQEARLRELARELRCLVCQNESLAESHAPLAGDLRDEIREQMRGGATDTQIIEYLVARYGDFVTYKPPFNLRTLGLWLGPLLIMMLLGAAVWSAQRRARAARQAMADAHDERHIQQEFHRLKREFGNRDD